MINDQQHIIINALPAEVYTLIENMPNKFPVYKILDTKPFLFLRMLFIDGFRSAAKTYKHSKQESDLVLRIGDPFGPFTVTELEKPVKYLFTLKSFFFHCQTGYFLYKHESKTKLNLDVIVDNPSRSERVWWFFIKPIHFLMTRKVLKEIKHMAEINNKSK